VSWPACAALLPHAQAALPADSDGLGRIANYLGSSGSYAAARADAACDRTGPIWGDSLAEADLLVTVHDAGSVNRQTLRTECPDLRPSSPRSDPTGIRPERRLGVRSP
jgi:hypothetical protein